MIPISMVSSGRFSWSTLPRNQGCELKQGLEVVGILRQASHWSSNYVARTAGQQWTFRRMGFWGSAAEIVDSVSQETIAIFKSSWGGRGTLTFADGEKFDFVCHGLWHPVWTVMTAAGEPVLSLHTREEFVDVKLSSMAKSRSSLLVLFTLYRVRQAEEDAASAATVA